MLELRLLERVREVPREAWDALLGPDSSPFVEWTWLDCLEESGCVGNEGKKRGGTGWLPRHLALFREGRLVAAAPTYLKGNSEGEFVFDWSWADVAGRLGVSYYPKLLVAAPFTPATGDRALVLPGEDRAPIVRAFADTLRALADENDFSSVHVNFPSEAEAAEWEAAGFLRRLGMQFHWRNEGYKTFDDFLARFNAKKRHQLKREMAHAGKVGIRIETLPESAITSEMVDAMHGFYGATVDKFYYGRRYLNHRFFELLAERFASRLSWVVASRDGVPIAGAFNVKSGTRLYGRYWGATEDVPFLHFHVCYYHGIAQCIAEGLTVFEPGAGGEHKRVRGFVPTLTHSAHWVKHPRLRQLVADFLARERVAITEHVAAEQAGSGMKDGAADDPPGVA